MPELAATDLSIARRFVAALGPDVPLVRLLVFGSRTRGDARADSDLDLLVVVERIDPPIRAAVLEAAWRAGFPDVLVSPVLVSRDELTHGAIRDTGAIAAALSEGIPL